MNQAIQKQEGGAEVTIHDTDMRAFSDADLALIDQQIATAKRYPRKLKTVLENIETMVTIDERVAESMFYSLERRENGGGKVYIRGPSIRMAEAFGSAWGNLRIETRIVGEEGGRWVVAEAVAADLETNTAAKVQVRRRITTKNGRRYSDDMIGVTAAAAQSIAYRNAMFRVIPRVYVERAQRQAENIVLGGAKPLKRVLTEALEFFSGHGITEPQVLAAAGIESRDEVQRSTILDLVGFANRMRDGELTVREFIELGVEDQPQDQAKDVNAALGLAKEEPEAEAAPEEKPQEAGAEEATEAPAEQPKTADLPRLLELYANATTMDQLEEYILPVTAPAEEWQMAAAFAKRCANKLGGQSAYNAMTDDEKTLCRKALGMLK